MSRNLQSLRSQIRTVLRVRPNLEHQHRPASHRMRPLKAPIPQVATLSTCGDKDKDKDKAEGEATGPVNNPQVTAKLNPAVDQTPTGTPVAAAVAEALGVGAMARAEEPTKALRAPIQGSPTVATLAILAHRVALQDYTR